MNSHPPHTVIAGKYRIDGLIGRGGMGNVYAATNTAIGRKVALKLLTPQLSDDEDIARRFQLEAQASAVINHPGIIDVLDMGQTSEGAPFIVMELLEGATLKQVQKEVGPFTASQMVAVVVPLLEALAAAHAAKVVHRDIKPANIFLCVKPRRILKVLDFGISRFGDGAGMTATGTSMGTPQFMAPEQARGERKNVGPAADIYSVGAIAYQLLSGKGPYDADSDIGTLARLLTDKHQPLREAVPDLTPAVADVIELMLQKNPAGRPSDALAVARRLSSLVVSDEHALFDVAATLHKPAITASGGFPSTPSSPARRAPPVATREEVALDPTYTPRPSNIPTTQERGNPPADDTDPKPRTPAPARRTPARTRAPDTDEAAAPVVDDEPVAAPARSRWPLWVGAAVFGAVASITAAILTSHPEKPPAPAPLVAPAPTPTPPAAPTLITFAVDAVPQTALITIDGQPPCNPCRVQQAKGSELHLVASADGYEAKEQRFTLEQNETSHLELTPAAPAPTPAPVGEKPKPGKPKKSKGLQIDENNPYGR